MPVHPELLPYLKRAVEESPSEFVFPGPDGEMMREDVKLQDVLRRALARAGIVHGYNHRCRKHGCKHHERHPDQENRRCPEHGCLLWPVPVRRKVRFHDLRHTAASLYMGAGVDPIIVQRTLGHADVTMTTDRYGHFSPDHEARQLAKLKLGVTPTQSVVDERVDGASGDSKAPAASPEIVSTAEALQRAGDGGRTRDPRLGNRRQLHPPRLHTSKPSQPFRVLRHIPTRRDAVDTGGRGAAGPPRDPGRASWVCPPPRRRSSPFARWRADSACAL